MNRRGGEVHALIGVSQEILTDTITSWAELPRGQSYKARNEAGEEVRKKRIKGGSMLVGVVNNFTEKMSNRKIKNLKTANICSIKMVKRLDVLSIKFAKTTSMFVIVNVNREPFLYCQTFSLIRYSLE